MINLDIINREIEKLAELVTITVSSNKTYSEWGDETATETETENVKAVYNVYSRNSSFESEGDFQNGDLTFFFKSDQSGIVNGTKITRANGEVFEISDVRSHGAYGNTYVKEALAKKV